MDKMGPLQVDHPLVMGSQHGPDWIYDRCPACHARFEAGQYLTLIAIGPGPDKEEQDRARAGRPYNAVAIPVHWDCAGGVE